MGLGLMGIFMTELTFLLFLMFGIVYGVSFFMQGRRGCPLPTAHYKLILYDHLGLHIGWRWEEISWGICQDICVTKAP